ncbi:hypothetical protein ACFL1C_10795, partial [Pseudomonadota bacterium]
MKQIFILVAAALLFSNAQAQDDADLIQVLPDDAQKCMLPASPDAIPEEATYEDLVAAKKGVADFQSELGLFR